MLVRNNIYALIITIKNTFDKYYIQTKFDKKNNKANKYCIYLKVKEMIIHNLLL